MSQLNSFSSSSAHASPVVAKSGAFSNYVLSFSLLILAAAIFYSITVMARDSGVGISSSEPISMPIVAQNIASSSEFAGTLAVAKRANASASSLRTIYADKQEGECFEFGRYPQSASGEIKPITWRVLQREKDYLLVIAEQGLDSNPYNEEQCVITWADCTLRRWLNSDFYEKAFNEQERECILPTTIVNNAGPNTEDSIFLLSIDEAKSLFVNDNMRRAKPTEYAAKNGVHVYDGCCWWWLRSRGYCDFSAAYVFTGGDIIIGGHYVLVDYNAVRPAFRIAL